MKKVMLALVSLAFVSLTARSQELIQNGQFSEEMSHWILNCHKHYGRPRQVKLEDGALLFSGLAISSQGYLNLVQAVMIEKDKTYILKMEVQGEAGESVGFSVGDPGRTIHKAGKHTFKGTSWEPVQLVITGKYPTDEKWFKAWHKLTRKNELEEGAGRTTLIAQKDLPEVKDYKKAGQSYLAFGLGSMSNAFSLRNISLTEQP